MSEYGSPWRNTGGNALAQGIENANEYRRRNLIIPPRGPVSERTRLEMVMGQRGAVLRGLEAEGKVQLALGTNVTYDPTWMAVATGATIRTSDLTDDAKFTTFMFGVR